MCVYIYIYVAVHSFRFLAFYWLMHSEYKRRGAFTEPNSTNKQLFQFCVFALNNRLFSACLSLGGWRP